jgi:hypothetical protein
MLSQEAEQSRAEQVCSMEQQKKYNARAGRAEDVGVLSCVGRGLLQ